MAVLDHTVTVELPPMDTTQPGGKPNPPRVYSIAGMGPGVRSQWVQIAKRKAWDELDSQAAFLPVSRYTRLEGDIFQRMAAGKYEWEDEVYQSMEGQPAGIKAILLARLRIGSKDGNLHPSVIDELIERHGFQRLILLMQQADGPILPNGQAPVGKEPTGESLMTNT